MLIGEVAKATGLTKDTIRYYTKMGLLDAQERQAGSRSYAEYDKESVKMLKEIKLAQSAGFTLNEIRDGLTEWREGKLDNTRLVELFIRKLEEVRQKQQELKQVEAILKKKIKTYSRK